jgi:hypothetical protein
VVTCNVIIAEHKSGKCKKKLGEQYQGAGGVEGFHNYD